MKILHTADWHLGRVFHRVDLLDDQRHALAQVVEIAKEERPDLVVVAGDIYDRSVPPAGAVELLDEILVQLVIDLELPTLVIAGNHDSMQRLGFGARLLAAQHLHVLGRPVAETPALRFGDAHGPVHVYALPYPEPALLREVLGDETLRDHQQAMNALVERIWQRHPEGERAVLVTHAHVDGGLLCDSERLLSVSRAQIVRPATFARFAYVALGHLHRPQMVGREAIQYAGSLFPYSFSEAGDQKSVTLVELGPQGIERLERRPLTLRHRVRLLEGELHALLAAAPEDQHRNDYLRVTLHDRGPVVEAMGRLREAYPNVLEVDRPFITGSAETMEPAPRRELSELEHFAAFYQHVSGEELPEELGAEVSGVLDMLRRTGS